MNSKNFTPASTCSGVLVDFDCQIARLFFLLFIPAVLTSTNCTLPSGSLTTKSINPSQNPDFRVRTLSVTDEREYTRKFTYNEPGEYTFKLEVVEQFDVLPTNNPELKAEAWVELFEND